MSDLRNGVGIDATIVCELSGSSRAPGNNIDPVRITAFERAAMTGGSFEAVVAPRLIFVARSRCWQRHMP